MTKYKITTTFIIDDYNNDNISIDNFNNKFFVNIHNDISTGNIELTETGITHWFYQSPDEIIKFDKVKIEKIE